LHSQTVVISIQQSKLSTVFHNLRMQSCVAKQTAV